MSDKLEIWDRFADIDPKFTKPITGKDYSGTSPNAHYVIRCLTEIFGPVGQGFGWRILREEFQPFGETTIHWCRIEFWHTNRANTFETYGQTKAAYKTKSGYMKVDEDAPKKSLTDAITKAAAQIGIAANIFLGRWDDNQYVAEVNDKFRDEEAKGDPSQLAKNAAELKSSIIQNVRETNPRIDLRVNEHFQSDLARLKSLDPEAVEDVEDALKEREAA